MKKLKDTINSNIFWIIFISLVLLLLYLNDNKEDFSPLEKYPTDPLPSSSSLKYNFISNDDNVNDKFQSVMMFNNLSLPNNNLNKPVYLMARSNGRVRQPRLIN